MTIDDCARLHGKNKHPVSKSVIKKRLFLLGLHVLRGEEKTVLIRLISVKDESRKLFAGQDLYDLIGYIFVSIRVYSWLSIDRIYRI